MRKKLLNKMIKMLLKFHQLNLFLFKKTNFLLLKKNIQKKLFKKKFCFQKSIKVKENKFE
jgi:hypothetical protein